jgi:hypothetical protein
MWYQPVALVVATREPLLETMRAVLLSLDAAMVADEGLSMGHAAAVLAALGDTDATAVAAAAAAAPPHLGSGDGLGHVNLAQSQPQPRGLPPSATAARATELQFVRLPWIIAVPGSPVQSSDRVALPAPTEPVLFVPPATWCQLLGTAWLAAQRCPAFPAPSFAT